MLLSILIPVYNERTVVERSLHLVMQAPLPDGMEREIILVDDCSSDGTSEILVRIAATDSRFRLYRQDVNQGKGAAVRRAIELAQGDFCLIQDADLEYDPNEYPALLKPLVDGRADAVFGSRYLNGEQRRVLPYWHTKINQTLTLASNIFSNIHVTDMETCYKVFRTELLKSIPIRSDRFGFEPEITMKCAKRKLRIYEVPISYHGRTYEEGKKIGWRDGVKALGVILYFWLVDDLYKPPYDRGHLYNLTGTPSYLSWQASILRPYLGDTVLELGAGMGNLTGRLMAKRLRYIAAEKDPLYLHALVNRFLRTPSVEVRSLDPAVLAGLEDVTGKVETALCINILEYLENPEQTLTALHQLLQSGGRVVVLSPCNPNLFGSLDRSVGHLRRFSELDLRKAMEQSGFTVEECFSMNKAGALAWWVNSKLLSSARISRFTLKAFDLTVWLWSRIDRFLPWGGLSIVAVGRK